MNIKDIQTKTNLPRKQILFELDNAQVAKNYEISLLFSVREQWRPLDLIARGPYLILDGPVADSYGVVIPEQEAKVNEVAEKIKNTILNDVPGFKDKIERIIVSYQNVEGLELGMASAIDQALKGKTKQRFMAQNDLWVYAKIIKKAMDQGPYSSFEEFDTKVNAIFDDSNIITGFIKEIEDWKKRNS